MQAGKTSPGYSGTDYNKYLNDNRVFDPKIYNVTVAAGVATVTNSRSGGAVSSAGATANYTYQETLVDSGVCTSWLPNISQSQYASVTVGATTLPTPIDGATASTNCGTTPVTVKLTSKG